MLFRKVKDILTQDTGVSEMMGSAFLLIFVVLMMATPLKNVGNTIKAGYNNLNLKIQNQLSQIP